MRKSHAQTQTANFFRKDECVAAWLRTECSTTTRHQDRTARTLTSSASTFLLERLLTATAHKTFCLSHMSTSTTASQLPLNYSVQNSLFNRSFENISSQIN